MTTEYFYEWVRLVGSNGGDYGRALTTGLDGSIYIAGSTSGDLDGQINIGSDDAFISKYNPDGTNDWTRLIGGSITYGSALTTGSDGSIYIAGSTRGDLDGQINIGSDDAFISKYNPDGTKEWTRLLGSNERDSGSALTTGSDGSIYIAGSTRGDLDGQINIGSDDAFISKYNPDGTKEWTRLVGSNRQDSGSALTTGSDGSIYIAGSTRGDLDGQRNSGGNDAFISKFNPDGTKEWTRLLGSYSLDEGYALTTGSDGSIYIAGYTWGDLDGQTNYFIHDAFISKFNPDGIKEWTKLVGTYEFANAIALTTGSDGSIYIAGSTTPETNPDAYISYFNQDGKREWTTLLGSSLYEYGSALTTGSDGSIYIAGHTSGDLDGQINSGDTDAFISKMSVNAARLTFSYAPTDILFSETNFNEHINSGVVATLSTTDPEFIDSHTYQFISGTGDTDNSFFSIEGSNLKINSSPDYEYKSSYSVRLKTTDLGGLSYEEQVTLNVIDINEVPTDIYTDFDLGGYIISENISSESVFTTLRTSDIDDSDFHTYSLVSGEGDEDNELFTIQGDQLKINISPDYETQSSYNIRLKTIDSGELSYEEAFTFYLRNLNEIATDISLSSTSFNENISSGSVVATLSTTDDDSSDSHTYSLVSGAGDTNNSLFTIEGSSLKINSSPDYENNSSYSIRLKTTDRGGLFYEEAVTLRVNDLIDQTPTDISTSSTSFNENINAASTVATLSTTDEDASDTHTYELVSGDGDTDNSLFTIEGSELKINSSPDYETQSSYSIRLKTKDSGDLTYEEAFTFDVSDINEVATDISLSASSFDENINAASTVATLSTTDEDASDTHTYELVSGDGDIDNSLFTIEGSELKINSSPDYETQSSYSIRLKTKDSGDLTYEEAFTFDVNDINEVATDISLSASSFDENINAASTVATLSTTDEDASDSHTYELVNGTGDTDNALFAIEGSELKINSSPDYETKSSYDIRLKTTDSGGLSYEESIALSVNDINEVATDILLNVPEFEWTKLLETYSANKDNVERAIIGSDGSIYIAGTTRGDLDGQTNSVDEDVFISKFSADAEKQWSRLIGSSENECIYSLTTGSDGSIYIAGSTEGDLDGQTNSGDGEEDAFISKFSADGEKQWTKLFGSYGEGNSWGLATGLDGSVYITGETSNPYDDAFISKFSADGEKQWTQLIGSNQEDEGRGIIIGSDGYIYIVGATKGDIDEETNPSNNGQYDWVPSKSRFSAFISKFSTYGEKQWTQIFGSLGEDDAFKVTTGLDGSVYITGETTGNLDSQTNSGDNDAFISKYNPDGTKDWTRLLGTDEHDVGYTLTTGSDGSIYIAGSTEGDLDGQTNSGDGEEDAFISKFSADGEKQWTKLFGSSEGDRAFTITTGLDGSIKVLHATWDADQDHDEIKLNISMSKFFDNGNTINENIDAGSTVANLSTTDKDSGDSHTYELVSGTGDTDNDSFTIEGSNLKINSSPDYETKSSYSIRIKTTDSSGLSYEEVITLRVNLNSNVIFSIASKSSIPEGGTLTTTIKTTEVPNNTILYWSLSGDGIDSDDVIGGNLTGSGKVKKGKLNLKHKFDKDLITEGDENLKLKLFTDSALTDQVGETKEITIEDVIPTYAIKTKSSIAEGGTLKTSIKTKEVPNNKILYWSLSGNNIDSDDVIGGNLTGSGKVKNGKLNLSHKFDKDLITEGDETLKLKLFTDSALTEQVGDTKEITIEDVIPTYAIKTKSSIAEGGTLKTSIKTTEVPNNTILYWSLSGDDIDSDDVIGGNLTGSGKVKKGKLNLKHKFDKDLITEGDETVELKLFTDSDLTEQVGETKEITIEDVIPTYAIKTKSSIAEGGTLKTSIKTKEVPNNKILYWSLSGNNIDSDDVIGGNLTGSGKVKNGKLNLIHKFDKDLITEGDENLELKLFTDSALTEQVGDTKEITIEDVIPTYAIKTKSSIAEGGKLKTNIKTTDVPNNTRLYWSLSGDDIDSEDLSKGSLTGSGLVKKNKFSIKHTLAKDLTTEGNETLEIKLFTDAALTEQVGETKEVVILDKSKSRLSSARLFSKSGEDKLYGDRGDDNLRGDSTADYLYGVEENVKLYSEKDNTLIGGIGEDDLIGGIVEDRVDLTEFDINQLGVFDSVNHSKINNDSKNLFANIYNEENILMSDNSFLI